MNGPNMEKYLTTYPKQKQDMQALAFQLGFDEADKIAEKALLQKKKIKILTDARSPDWLDYILE